MALSNWIGAIYAPQTVLTAFGRTSAALACSPPSRGRGIESCINALLFTARQLDRTLCTPQMQKLRRDPNYRYRANSPIYINEHFRLIFVMPIRTYVITNDLGIPHPPPRTRLYQNHINKPASISYFKMVVGMARGGVFGADQGNFVNVFPLVKSMADRFLSAPAGILCTHPSRPLNTSLVDHARTAFAGLIGYGMATAHAEQLGSIWFAHFEEVRGKTSINPPAGTTPLNTPDLMSLDRRGVLRWLECKGSFATLPDIWTEKVTGPYRTQVAPWLGATIHSASVLEGRVIGTHISPTGTTVSSIYTQPTAGALVQSATFPTAIILPHYARWLSLFGSVMWPLVRQLSNTQKPQQSRTTLIQFGQVRLGGHTFVTSLVQGPYCQTPCFEGQPIYLGIRQDLLEMLVKTSLDPETTDLADSQFVQMFSDQASEEEGSLLIEARQSGYENFCSFNDYTIAFTRDGFIDDSSNSRAEIAFEINFDEG